MEISQTLIDFYILKNWNHHVQRYCDKVLETKGNDPVILFWRAFSMILEKTYTSAVRELDALKRRREVELPCLYALIYAHSHCKHIDHDEIANLELQIVMAEENAGESAVFLCAKFFWHTNEYAKARKYLDQLDSRQTTPEIRKKALIIRGWLDLTKRPDTKKDVEIRRNSIQFFEQANSMNDADLLLGLAKYHEMRKDYAQALQIIDDFIVKFPGFNHSISEKAILQLKTGNWDACIDSVKRALQDNKQDIEALRLLILHELTQKGKTSDAEQSITEIHDVLTKAESNNANILLKVSRTIARVSDHNSTIIFRTLLMIDDAIHLQASDGALYAEKGYQRSLLKDYSGAIDSYKEALKYEESNESALHGLIYCQIKLGQYDDAYQQMEFLSVIQESIGESPWFVFLQACLCSFKNRDRLKQIKLLRNAVQLHMKQLHELTDAGDVSMHDLMYSLNPKFLVEIAHEIVKEGLMGTSAHAGEDRGDRDPNATAIIEGISILEKLLKKSPGFLQTQILLARCYLTVSRYDDAYHVCNVVIKLNCSLSEAHLIMARVCLEREHIRAASTSLDEALSQDFKVRQTLSYHVIKAKILESEGNNKESLRHLQNGMKLIQEKSSKAISRTEGRSKHANLRASSFEGDQDQDSNTSLSDKAMLYVQMAQVLCNLNDLQQATEVIQEATEIFRSTSHEVSILVANSELAVKRGDYDRAIAILNDVPSSSPAFMRAQMVKADIYLLYRKDRDQYARCYREIAEKNPSVSTYTCLSEAYSRIQMLDEAISALHAAMEIDRDDFTIVGRIGKIMVLKHDYLKAIDFYENALRSTPRNFALRKDLAELYTRTKHFDQALRVVKEAPFLKAKKFDTLSEVEADEEEISDLTHLLELQLMLPRIYTGIKDDEASIEALLKAYSMQKLLLSKQKHEQPDVIDKQERAIAETCYQISELHVRKGTRAHVDTILKYCGLALQSDDGHEATLALLARVYQQTDQIDQCEMQCLKLMRLNPSNEEAAIMLADLMLQKDKSDSAVIQFKQILEAKPDNYFALSRFIIMLRRTGQLAEAPSFLLKAEHECKNRSLDQDSGLHFCKGIYARYTNKIRDAVKEFNFARRDLDWGEQALLNMIEIYLNPDNDNFWDNEANPSGDSAAAGSGSITKEQSENLRIANALLDELPNYTLHNPSMSSKQQDLAAIRQAGIQILEGYAMLAMKSKPMSEKAVQAFLEVLETKDRDYVPALLGLSTAYMLTKQQPKARNQLKRIAKMTYNQQFADEFERSYLMLADLYIQRSKYDLAQELCRKALAHNKSCGKAWETSGLIMEKEQSYVDAANCYREAWICEGEASAAIGFKLAFNYLKAKKFVAAVNVCHKVLFLYPDYPKIRNDILEKAYAGFRP